MTEKHIDKARELVEEFSIAAERHVREMQEKQAQFTWDWMITTESVVNSSR
jgi:hypothetical protein